jgi:hypothetical protein
MKVKECGGKMKKNGGGLSRRPKLSLRCSAEGKKKDYCNCNTQNEFFNVCLLVVAW